MTRFTAPWLVEGSFEKTLRGLMAMADPGAFAGLSPEQIREALVDELRFIAPYDENEEQAAEAYIHRQEKHAHEVVMHVASQLQRLGKAFLRTVAERMVQLAGESPLTGDLPDNLEALAVLTAARMVSHREVTEVVGFLVRLMQEVDQEQADKIASIVSHLLPLNYAPGAARQLSERMTKEQFGLLEDEVSTRTLAEIIMAGYDQKPANFAGFTVDNDLRGHTALDHQDGPEEGPGDLQSSTIGVLRAARNLLLDLLALKDTTFGLPSQSQPLRWSGGEEAELRRDIAACATRLRGALTALSTIKKRIVYCVLKLPEQPQEREFRTQVLREVSRAVPQLIFVELAPPNAKREREFEVLEYMRHIQARVIPTPQGHAA